MTLSLDEERMLSEAMNAVKDGDLTGWNKTFWVDQRQRYEQYGAEIFLSPKQWGHIIRIYQEQTGQELV